MLYNLFNTRFGRYMARLGDLILLQAVFLLTSLPVITAGAGIAALYSVSKKMRTDSALMVLPAYFAAFKSNFRKATLLWLALLAAGALMFFDLRFLRNSDAPWIGTARIVFYIAIGVWYLLFLYAFPLEAWYDNTVGRHLANSMRLSLSHVWTTLLLTAVNALLFTLAEYAKAIALLIGASGCIYLKTFFLGRLLFPEQFKKEDGDEEK